MPVLNIAPSMESGKRVRVSTVVEYSVPPTFRVTGPPKEGGEEGTGGGEMAEAEVLKIHVRKSLGAGGAMNVSLLPPLSSFLFAFSLPPRLFALSPLPSLLEWTSIMRLLDVNFLFIYTIDKNHQTQAWLPVLAQRPPPCAGGQSPSVGTSDLSWGLVLLISQGSKCFCLFLRRESHSK